MTRLGVWYDFRNPARWRLPWQQLYTETLDQAVYAEELGFDSIWLSEHHFTDEGYLPCLPAVLGTLAARTTSCPARSRFTAINRCAMGSSSTTRIAPLMTDAPGKGRRSFGRDVVTPPLW